MKRTRWAALANRAIPTAAFLTTLLLTTIAGLVAAPSASAAVPGLTTLSTWQDTTFNTTVFDTFGDRFKTTYQPAKDPNTVEFQLHTAANITWWKQLSIVNPQGQTTAADFTQDAKHDTGVFRVTDGNTTGWTLVFAKAKLFGTHTNLFQVPIDLNTSYYGGARLGPARGLHYDITWTAD